MKRENATKAFVYSAQTCLWVLFIMIDFYLWIPSLLYRKVMTKIHQHTQRQHQQQQYQYQQGQRARRGLKGRPPPPPRARPSQTVVIVGGNFAGLAALRELQSNHFHSLNVILIDQRDYFEYTPGVLRLFCEPHEVTKLVHSLSSVVKDNDGQQEYKFIQGSVTQVYKNHLLYVDTGAAATQPKPPAQTLNFDYLIMATGSTYSHPVSALKTESTIPVRAQGWKEWSRRVRNAQSILILGGGAVGTELAAEIADHYNSNNPSRRKSITLVDASPRLVPLFAPRVSEYAAQWLRSHGVKLVLGQMLETWDSTSCTLKATEKQPKQQQRLEADLVFVCFGDKPNSNPLVVTKSITDKNNSRSFIPPPTPPAPKLDRRKCVHVDSFLRVEGRPNVFCCGDVACPPTEAVKQAFHAEVQGHIAGANIVRLATGHPFLRYPEDATLGSPNMPLVYVLSLGQWDGVIGFNSITVPGPLAPILKWILEWTKIRQMLGRPIGILVWMIGDAVTFFLSKSLVPPVSKTKNA